MSLIYKLHCLNVAVEQLSSDKFCFNEKLSIFQFMMWEIGTLFCLLRTYLSGISFVSWKLSFSFNNIFAILAKYLFLISNIMFQYELLSLLLHENAVLLWEWHGLNLDNANVNSNVQISISVKYLALYLNYYGLVSMLAAVNNVTTLHYEVPCLKIGFV